MSLWCPEKCRGCSRNKGWETRGQWCQVHSTASRVLQGTWQHCRTAPSQGPQAEQPGGSPQIPKSSSPQGVKTLFPALTTVQYYLPVSNFQSIQSNLTEKLQ